MTHGALNVPTHNLPPDLSDPPFVLPVDWVDTQSHRAQISRMTEYEFKEARTKLGLTQAALARRLGLCTRQIIRYEQATRPIPLLVQLSMSLFLLEAEKSS